MKEPKESKLPEPDLCPCDPMPPERAQELDETLPADATNRPRKQPEAVIEMDGGEIPPVAEFIDRVSSPTPATKQVELDPPAPPPAGPRGRCSKCGGVSIGMAGGMRRCNQCGHSF